MSTRNSLAFVACLLASSAAPALAQLDGQSMHITFPEDSPLTVLAANWGESTATPRGGAMVLDLHTSLTLRNAGQRRIRGVTLQVMSQEVTPGGKGSTTVCSLNIGPGESFPVRIDLRLLRPLHAAGGPLVEIGLDGVLFSDLTFYGPNKLNSRRSMTGWEMEARRDREYFKNLLQQGGASRLKQEMQATLARQGERARNDMQMARLGRATALEPERSVQFTFLDMPDSPIEARRASGRLAGDEIRAPRIELRNRTDRAVRSVEMGWVVRDRNGSEALAGMVPAEVKMRPGGFAELNPGGEGLRISRQGGQKVELDSVSTFINSVEYEDGKLWIPARDAIASKGWSRLIAPSPEEQRLVELYRTKGLQALINELDKF